jgi:chemotaxis protein CheZ
MQQYIGFKLNNSEFTIPIMKVREIVNTPVVTSLPQSPHYMKGVINLRGSIIPVLDLKQLISMESTGEVSPKTIVITSGGQVFGVLVDEITSVIKIDEADIESADSFVHEHIERVEGVARFDDRLLIMLDTDKLVNLEELGILDEGIAAAALEAGDTSALAHEEAAVAAVQRAIESARPEPTRPLPSGREQKARPGPPIVSERELHEVKDALSHKYPEGDVRGRFVSKVVELIEALAEHKYDLADEMIIDMTQSSEGSLFREIGMVTRRLHDSLKEFKNALDPRIKQIADEEVPNAVDSLEYVITRTEDAANRTMGIVEKHLKEVDGYHTHLKKLKGPKGSVAFLGKFMDTFYKDLTEILLAQEFQDITGQTIRKVIELVNTIEAELVGLITTFGVKPEKHARKIKIAELISQDDVDNLLKEFGF